MSNTPRSMHAPRQALDTAAVNAQATVRALALETRFMFDAAAVATGAEVLSALVAAQQANTVLAEAARHAPSGTISSETATHGEVPSHAAADAIPRNQFAELLSTGSDSKPPTVSTAPDYDDLSRALQGLQSTSAEHGTQIVFVDSSVDDVATLLQGISPSAEVIFLDARSDGLTQIETALRGRTDVAAIHIISHGEQGEIELGDTVYDMQALSARSDTLAAIGRALTTDGDILLYGCDTAQGASGRMFVDRLATLTGADVAASTDLTGSARLGGDWNLEYRTGAIDAPVIVDARTQEAYDAVLAAPVSNTSVLALFTDKTIRSVDPVTGRATVVATIPASIVSGGTTYTIGTALNGLSVDRTNGLIYYFDNTTTSGARTLYAYDYINNQNIVVAANLVTLGVTNGDQGVGGAAFSNGSLYFGVENTNLGAAGNDTIYRATLAADGRSVSSVSVFTQAVAGGADWGDLSVDVANNALLSVALNTAGTVTLVRYDLTSGNQLSSAAYGSTTAFQAAFGANGTFYAVGGTSATSQTIQSINPTTGATTGTAVAITTNGSTSVNAQASDAASYFVSTGTIGDKVFDDNNADGVFGTGDNGIANVTVQLYDDVNGNGTVDAGDRLLATDTTNASGDYLFTGVLPGTYIVQVNDANGALGGSTPTNGSTTRTVTIGTIGASDTSVDFSYQKAPPVVDLNSGVTTGDTVTNGTFTGNANGWTLGGTTVYQNNSIAWIADVGTGTLTQTGLTGLQSGPGTFGAAQLAFSFGWNNPFPDPDVNSVLTISVGGVVYATINTGRSSQDPNNATITYSNGASGPTTTVAASTFNAWTYTDIVINLPTSVANSGSLVFSFDPGAGTVVHDDISIDNVRVLRTADNLAGRDWTATFTEDGSAVAIAGPNVSVNDSDSANMASAQVVLTNGQANDLLRLGGTALANGSTGTVNGITYNVAVSGGVTTINLAGSATRATYAALIGSITFENTSQNPAGSPVRDITVTVNDGISASNTAHAFITVVPVNDPPVLATGSTAAYTENDAGVVINPSLTVSDVDNTTLTSATVSITGNFVSGQDLLSFTGSAATGNIAAAYSATTGVLTLTSAGGTATLAQWQAALRAVQYANSSDNPSTAARTVSYTANDGAANSNTVTSTVNVTAVNDPPVLATSSAVSYTENAAGVPINTALTVSDLDNGTLATATVSVTGNFAAGQDVLSFTNNGSMGNITASYNATTGVMTLTSAGSTATLAQWQAALRAVQYSNSSDNPSTAARTVSYVVNDGAANSNAVSSTVNVIAVNDPPVLATGSTTTYTENGTGTAISPALTVNDLDNTTLTSATVSVTGNFASGQDVLSFTGDATTGNITATYNATTGVMSLTSAGSTATLAQWQAALRAVQYANSSDNPSTAARTVSYTVNDGAANSNTVTSTVNVVAVNDPPVLATGSTTAYTENGAGIAVSPALTVNDLDNSTLTSATVAVTGNFASGQDVLSFTGDATTGNITAVYNPTTGVMTLSSAGGSATLAQWQAALRAVQYANSSDNPSTATRTVSYTVNDGAANSNIVTSTVSVTAVNDPPVLANGSAVSYTENGAGLPVNSALTVTDLDNATLTTATVSVTGNFAAGQDILSFTASGSTGNIAASYNAATGVLTLSSAGGNATLAQWQAALRAVQYSNSSDNPSTATRTVSYTVNDGAANSNTVNSTVSVAAVNDPPVLANGSAVSYTENGAGLPVNSALTVTDLDNTTLTSATVGVTGNFVAGEDILSFTPSGSTGNIAASYNAATGVLTLSSAGGNATLAQWQAALRAVQYANSSDNPSTATRTVSYTVNDGAANSNTVNSTVSVTAVNDAPVNTVPGAQTTAEDTPLTISGVSVADIDSASLTTTVTVVNGTANVSTGGGATISGNGTASITLSGTAAQINAALAGLTYTNTPDYNGPASLTISTSDGTLTDTDAISISVTPVADITNDTVSTNEDTAVTFNVITGTGGATADSFENGARQVTSITQPANGSVSFSADGTMTFTPALNFNGTTSFTYTVTSGGVTETATVTVNVVSVNDDPVANPDLASTQVNTPLNNIDVLANDTDVDGGTLSVLTASANPAEGTVSVNPNGTLNFTPALNFSGNAVVSYVLSDGQGGTATGTLTVNVSANTPPQSTDATATGTEDTPVVLGLGNFPFSDPDAGQTMANVRIDTLPTAGTLLLNGTPVAAGRIISASDIAAGALTFVPAPDANGATYATLTFSVQDSAGGFDTTPNTLTFSIAAVNDAPIANGDALATPEDQALVIAPATLLANDTDVDGDTLTITSVQGAVNGTVALVNGTVVFTPTANYNGPASFTYTVNDGQGGVSTTTVTVNVAAVNDAPVASALPVVTPQDTAVDGQVVASDVEGDPLSFAIAQGPGHGTVTLNPDGIYRYVPATNFSGADTLTVAVSDGQGGTTLVAVQITVNPVNAAPVLTGSPAIVTLEDTPVSGVLPVADPNGDRLTFSVTEQPQHGTLTLNADGTYTYLPAADYAGTDTFVVQVSDGRGGTLLVRVPVAVQPVNDTPIARNDVVVTAPDTAVTIAVLANDFDIDGDRLSVIAINGQPVQPGATVPVEGGQLTINADGTLRFVPAAGFTGIPSFTYTVSDGQGGTAVAAVTIDVRLPTTADVQQLLTMGGAGIGKDPGRTEPGPDRELHPIYVPQHIIEAINSLRPLNGTPALDARGPVRSAIDGIRTLDGIRPLAIDAPILDLVEDIGRRYTLADATRSLFTRPGSAAVVDVLRPAHAIVLDDAPTAEPAARPAPRAEVVPAPQRRSDADSPSALLAAALFSEQLSLQAAASRSEVDLLVAALESRPVPPSAP